MKIFKWIVVSLFIASFSYAVPAQIILIRHGEKDAGSELSPIGWQRAKALPTLFQTRQEFLRFGPPVGLYAMAPSHDGGSVRAIQTLKFVSEALKIPIRTAYMRDQVSALVTEIRNDPRFDGKTVLVCWQHEYLVNIATALGVTNPPAWPSTQFDRAWVLSFAQNGQLAQFQDLPQKLLPTDSQK